MELKFYKEEDERWYVNLPEYPGEKADLEMVLGADILCDILSHRESNLIINTQDCLTEYTKVILHRWEPRDEMSGAYYRADFENPKLNSFDLWLCDVTQYVFGDFPPVIYIY